ncbi:MAG TPA: hypothetical protein VK921_17815 [Anditalea sp.]|nr:hypothetical protein [Anditalea sp.]
MEILGAVIVAVIISSIFYFAVDVRGPWGSFWTFFIIVLLSVWAASLWIVPFGYIYWEIAWIPLFFIGLVIEFYWRLLHLHLLGGEEQPKGVISLMRMMNQNRHLQRLDSCFGYLLV